jgi:hypothetical protein
MLFRPTFCANCGEKIERVQWGLLTSRRFCEVCETEFKGTELLPRVVVATSLLLGAAGLTTSLRSGPTAGDLAVREPKRSVSQLPSPSLKAESSVKPENAATERPLSINAANSVFKPEEPVRPEGGLTAAKTAAEPIYYCGAATKKGTPCSRKVKGNVRCYQHEGMPAMLPPDKLRAN